jgi:hypothetical protein
MFIQYEDLSYKNCAIQTVRFVKSFAKRPKTANICIADNIIIEAKLHATDKRRRLRNSEPQCYGYCSNSHMVVLISDDKLFHNSKSGIKEFKNPWLLKHIMKNIFRERK